ncbi:unnamed protein product, partial [Sphagnum tenellum]
MMTRKRVREEEKENNDDDDDDGRKEEVEVDKEEEEEEGCEIEYEKLRNARLAENKKRMAELGLVDLSHSLTEVIRLSSSKSGKSVKVSRTPKPPNPPCPSRRSSRLQGAPVVSYSELRPKGEGKTAKKGEGIAARHAGRGGQSAEIYTAEHEKLLGSAAEEWHLFADGYAANGNRVYDPVLGKTCHQCRQKTLGHRTSCSECKSLHGQFCGDCLYMRYGENVLEAMKNKNWVCPVCRKICNCSFCRIKRGWTPTGALYKKVKALGYKSVAHYLILTRRGKSEEKEIIE